MSIQAWLALALHLVVLSFYVLSGLLAPPYAVVLLLCLWLLLLWWLFRLRHERWKAMTVPAVAVAVWFTVLMLGDAFLGWTA